MNQILTIIKRNRQAVIAALICAVALSAAAFVFYYRQGIPAEAAFSLKNTLIGVVGFSTLFLYASEARLVKCEKEQFRAFQDEQNAKGLLLEGALQLVLAGVCFLFFYMLGRQQVSVYRAGLYCVAAVVCALAVIHTKLKAGYRTALSVLSYGLIAAYSYYVLTIHGYTKWTDLGLETFVRFAVNLKPWIHTIGLLLVIAEFKVAPKRAVAICAIGLPLYLVSKYSGFSLIAEFCGFVLLSNLFASPNKTGKLFLGVFAAYIVFVALGFVNGWVENIELFFPYAGWTKGYGMSHSNLVALVLMSTLFTVWYLWLVDRPAITLLIFWIAAIGIWQLTFCRTVVITMGAFPVMNYISFFCRTKKRAKAFGLLVWIPILFAAFSVIGMYWIPTQKLFSVSGNFFARFTYPYRAAMEYGIHPFGAIVGRNYVIDNVFLHLLVFYGYAALAVVTGLLMWVSYRYYKNGQYVELTLLTTYLLYSLMENAMVHLPFGFAALLVAGAELKPKEGKENEKQPLEPQTC